MDSADHQEPASSVPGADAGQPLAADRPYLDLRTFLAGFRFTELETHPGPDGRPSLKQHGELNEPRYPYASPSMEYAFHRGVTSVTQVRQPHDVTNHDLLVAFLAAADAIHFELRKIRDAAQAVFAGRDG